MANFVYDESMSIKAAPGLPYPGTQSLDGVPVQDRLNSLVNCLRAIHLNLDAVDGAGLAQQGEAKAVNGIPTPAAMPGLCNLSEQAIQLAEHLEQRVRILGGRLGRL